VLGVVLTHVSPRDYPSYSYSAYSDGSKEHENGKKPLAHQTGNVPGRRNGRS
jgi:hypothetical protein